MENRIIINDLKFKPYISSLEIQQRISEIGKELANAFADKKPIFIGILNGATIFHADLIRACNFELETGYISAKSYNGLESTGDVKISHDESLNIENKHIVLVEDIADSGLTLKELYRYLKNKKIKSLTTIILLDKPTARKTTLEANIIGFEIENKFVVGYGLDYNGIGRNLSGIYQLDTSDE